MDLNLYLRVIWRFRFLVLLGIILAVVLAGLAMFKVSFKGGSPSFAYRQHEVWQSRAVLLVTQRGFPEGRTVLPYQVTTVGGQQTAVSQFADPGRFTDLAMFYSTVAQSDAVQSQVYRHTKVRGSVSATPVSLGSGSKTTPLPLFSIDGSADTRPAARTMAEAGTAAFIKYLADEQAAANVPEKDRVVVQVVNAASPASLVVARKKTMPIVVFLTVLFAALGLAFILENLRPLVRPVEVTPAERLPEASAGIRSA
jgi:hypothetical protein